MTTQTLIFHGDTGGQHFDGWAGFRVGRAYVLTYTQEGDEVRVPLPPLAAAIWAKYEGQLPVSVQQYRNRHMKALMERAKLTRDFVRVRYVRGEATEEVVPLWQVVTTHTARHTGADMVMLGSGGDSNLKEKALGARQRLRPRRARALRPGNAGRLGAGVVHAANGQRKTY